MTENTTADLVAELRERAAFYRDRPAVPAGEYPAAREISAVEAQTIAALLLRAARMLAGELHDDPQESKTEDDTSSQN